MQKVYEKHEENQIFQQDYSPSLPYCTRNHCIFYGCIKRNKSPTHTKTPLKNPKFLEYLSQGRDIERIIHLDRPDNTEISRMFPESDFFDYNTRIGKITSNMFFSDKNTDLRRYIESLESIDHEFFALEKAYDVIDIFSLSFFGALKEMRESEIGQDSLTRNASKSHFMSSIRDSIYQ